MRLYVAERHSRGRREAEESADLIDEHVVNFLWRHLHRPSAEADEIRQSRVRTDPDTVRFRRGDRLPHHRRITAMKPAGDIGRRHVGHDRLVGTDLVGAEALSHVAIDVGVHSVSGHSRQR